MSNQVQPGTVQTDVVSSDTGGQKGPLAANTSESDAADQQGTAKPKDASSLSEVEEEKTGNESDSDSFEEIIEDEEPPPDSGRGKLTGPVGGGGAKTGKPRPPRAQISVPTKGKTRN